MDFQHRFTVTQTVTLVSSIKKLNRLITLSVLIAVLNAGSSCAQKNNALEVPVRLEVEKGKLDNIVVKVKKNGVETISQAGIKNMHFNLEFNQQYTMVFSKDGFVTKTIEFNTKASAERIQKGFEPYKIGVKLFLQVEDNAVVYNQPVGIIKFDANLDDFSYETDYSKSILSSMTDDKPVSRKKENINTDSTSQSLQSKSIQPVASAPPPVTKSEASVTPVKNESQASLPSEGKAAIKQEPSARSTNETQTLAAYGETKKETIIQPKAVTNPPARGTNGTDMRKQADKSSGSDPKKPALLLSANSAKSKSAIGSTGSETNIAALNTHMGSDLSIINDNAVTEEKVLREDVVEKNRVITRVKVIRGSRQTEYTCVNYSWGGKYFFRNNLTSISENLFTQWTGVQP